MEKQEVTAQDYRFLLGIMSVQYALISSSADPVVLRKVGEGANFEMNTWGGMFYDTCEAQKTALATMGKRVEMAEQDIGAHFDFHSKGLANFLEMDRAITVNKREIFAENCERMCEGFLKYLELVKQHKGRRGDEGFLEYPSCPPGHYFYVFNGSSIGTCYFNGQLDSFEAESGIKVIQEQIADFRKRPEKLPYINLPLGGQHGAGLLLPDFKRNLTWNKQLLERLGLKLPSLTSENG